MKILLNVALLCLMSLVSGCGDDNENQKETAGLVIRSQSRGQSCWTWVKRAFILPIHRST